MSSYFSRVREEGLERALDEVERLARRVESGDQVESWELHEIARRLQVSDVD